MTLIFQEDYDPEFHIESLAGVAQAYKKRARRERRSADCGRQEGGKFGPGNQCQDEGQGGPSSPLDTNESKSWTPAYGPEPFDGASRFSEVRASGGKKVAESLEKAGLSPGEALEATGAPDRSEVWMRPAPEFSGEFPGSESPPVMVNFDSDVAGVRRGMSGSSVIGSANGEKAIYHSVFEVLPAVQADPAKRHAAAREFYKTMVASVEAARKSGIAEIKFSAAGSSGDSDDKTAFRGYTIWPRMGFDAPLPDRIRSKLPESLSHAKSLLDLHATREGTKWWADNGEDIDVSFRVGDRSSPQSQIMDRFIKHFTKQRRSMPLGTGTDWLSPEDLLRLDEMWQEVWDEGDLDDYEYVEKRAADCGRTEDGKFDAGNQCQRGAKGVAALAKAGASHDELVDAISQAIGTKRGLFSGAERGESAPSEVLEALGINVGNDWEIDRYHASSNQQTREAIARTIAEAYAAVEADPSLKSVEFSIQTAESIAKRFGTSASRWQGVQGSYTPHDGEIYILAGTVAAKHTNEVLHDLGFSSTPHPGHTLVHEVAHKEHFDSIAAAMKLPRPPGRESDRHAEWASRLKDEAFNRLGSALAKDSSWYGRLDAKVSGLGFYATTDPLEFYAEYSTAVKLGYAKNDPDLDKMCKAMLAPVPKKVKR